MKNSAKSALRMAGMLVICGAMLFTMNGYARDTWTADTISIQTQDESKAEEGIPHAPWSELKEKYKDTVGYIKISGTDIDDVVVQGEDNNYYLRKSAEGKKDEYYHPGCYFVDYHCIMDQSQNTVIYGHNLMDENQKFGQLEKYRKLDFYKSNPVIYFDTPNVVGKWKIFAVFMTNNDKKDGVLFNYRTRLFTSQADFLTFIERCRRRSLVDCPVDVKEGDRILTLSTCDYQLNDGRFVVMARKVRDNEDESIDLESAKLNKNPLMPEGYYKKYGGTMPTFYDEPLLSDS